MDVFKRGEQQQQHQCFSALNIHLLLLLFVLIIATLVLGIKQIHKDKLIKRKDAVFHPMQGLI